MQSVALRENIFVTWTKKQISSPLLLCFIEKDYVKMINAGGD